MSYTRCVLVGGPFDGGEDRLECTPPAVGVYECPVCGLHWCDWRGGRPLDAVRYDLEEITDSCAIYVYGPMGDGREHDWIAEELREPALA